VSRRVADAMSGEKAPADVVTIGRRR
jgi:hypothetical protein